VAGPANVVYESLSHGGRCNYCELPNPASALFPMREDRERWDDILTRELALANDRIGRGSVTPTLDLPYFRGELANFDFRTP
jgi:hypothetical protein